MRRIHGETHVHHVKAKGDGNGIKEGVWMLLGKGKARVRGNHLRVTIVRD